MRGLHSLCIVEVDHLAACPRPDIRASMQARVSCVNLMKLTIKTQNSKMAFDLSQEEVESLVWTAFQYASGSQQYQEGDEPGLEVQPGEEGGGYTEEEGYAEDGMSGDAEEGTDSTAFPETAEEPEMPENPTGWEGTADFSGEPGGMRGQEEQEEAPLDPSGEAQEPAPYGPWAAPEERKRRHKGFLLIKCQHCGKLKGFCAKTPIHTYICDCGGKTPIQNLVPANASCKCGKTWGYRTNANDEMLEINCIECGSPIDMIWNARRGIYATLQDRN